MLLSTVRSSTTRLAVRAAPRMTQVAPRALSSFTNTLSKKEHVEEERYMREQERKFFEKKKAEMAAAQSENEMAVFEEVVAPAMVECQELLKKTKDEVSAEGLEALAKWKLGMKK